MRNIDYAGLYQQVLEGEKKGQWDGLTHDERTAKEINSNKARRISVNQAKIGERYRQKRSSTRGTPKSNARSN